MGSTEQDEDLEGLESTVLSTKHIALAVNEELDLHSRLLVCTSISESYIPFFSLAIWLNWRVSSGTYNGFLDLFPRLQQN